MVRRWVSGLALWAAMAGALAAQDSLDGQVWIQLESLPTLDRARLSAEGYSAQMTDVAGFYVGSGWYTVALGPYSPEEAQAVMANLMAEGVIPGDAAILEGDQFQQQFWPLGATGPTTEATVAEPAPVTPEPAPVIPEETYEEAQASEAALSLAQREQLQIALEWAGVYQGGIDGDFGPGTRAAMSAWQAQRGHVATGLLDSRQRAELLGDFNAILGSLGLRTVRDEAAGIEIELPMGVLGEPVTEPPFVRYDGREGVPPQVLLISQPGDQNRLWGLYEIMQTLEIVPLEGERSIDNDGFVLTGENEDIVSHTEVGLSDGALKGFTLIWPAGDEARRTRVLDRMQDSFSRQAGVLEAPAALPDGPDVDLVAGLQVRQPERAASGFFVDRAGHVLTSTAAVRGCARVTLDSEHEAQVVAQDEALGLAVLRPEEALAPRRVAQFQADPPRLQSEVAVAGYSFGGVLGAPTLTFGTVEEMQGLGGEEALKRLALASQPGDAGGPVMDGAGDVLGMLLPRDRDDTRRLPQNVSFATQTDETLAFLRQAGVDTQSRGGGGAALDPVDLTRMGAEMTVLVSCWE